MFCLLVVLPKLSLLAKWLARKTPLREPNRGEGIVSRKPRSKSVHDFLGLLYCFIVLLRICVVSCPFVIYYPTVMAWYSLFVLKVPLNPKQTNKPCIALSLLSSGVRLSVRPSVTLVDCIHTSEDIVKLLVQPGSPITLAFWPHAPIPNSKGNPFSGVQITWGLGGKNWHWNRRLSR